MHAALIRSTFPRTAERYIVYLRRRHMLVVVFDDAADDGGSVARYISPRGGLVPRRGGRLTSSHAAFPLGARFMRTSES
jgi:hypothetical protein